MNDKMNLIPKLVFCFLFLLLAFSSVSAQKDNSAKVKGRVTNYFGDSIADEVVKFFLLERKIGGGYVSAEGRFIKSARTDKEGDFEVSELPWGNYRIVAGSAEVWGFYLARNDDKILDLGNYIGYIHGFPQLEVSGTVKDSNKKSVKDATITLVNAFDETEVLRTRTNNNGEYKIQFIQPGQYILYVTKPGFSVTVSSFLINALKGTVYPETDKRKKIDVVLSMLKDTN